MDDDDDGNIMLMMILQRGAGRCWMRSARIALGGYFALPHPRLRIQHIDPLVVGYASLHRRPLKFLMP